MPGDFLTVQCSECENEQILFGNAATPVACAVCGAGLATPRGGKAQVHGEILEVVQRR